MCFLLKLELNYLGISVIRNFSCAQNKFRFSNRKVRVYIVFYPLSTAKASLILVLKQKVLV